MCVHIHTYTYGCPGGSVSKESACNTRDIKDMGSIPGSGRSPRKGNGNPTPVFLPGESHGQRSLAGYSPWGRKELDTTEWPTHTQKTYILYIHTHKHKKEYYYSAIKKNEIMPYAPNGWIGDYDTKSDGERQIPWYCLYTESKKSDTNELIYKTETDSQT